MTSSETPAPWAPPDLPSSRRSAGPRVSMARGNVAEDGRWLPPDLGAESVSGSSVGTADSERDADLEAARTQGFEEGRCAAEREGSDRLASAVGALGQAAAGIHAIRDAYARDLARNIEAVAIAIAQRIVEREIRSDPEVLRNLVARGLELVALDEPVDVRLHPTDLELSKEAIGRLLLPERSSLLNIVADPSLEPGNFLLSTPGRIVDGRVDTALSALYERLDGD